MRGHEFGNAPEAESKHYEKFGDIVFKILLPTALAAAPKSGMSE